MTSDTPPDEVRHLLRAWRDGDEAARAKLFTLVYSDLKACAARQLRRERAGHTLQTTALVHETYLRLVRERNVDWAGMGHFLAIAATAMRRVLVDHARARLADKRGGPAPLVTSRLDAVDNTHDELEVLAVHEAIDQLAAFDETQARLVELRFFGGFSIDEAAAVMGSSPATIKREWDMARAWLYRRLADRGDTAATR